MDGFMIAYHYTMCGLDYVYLRSGYREHDTDYGKGVSIECADNLDRAIAIRVIGGYARLRGQEVRFLRALMGRSQTDIANLLGVKRATVARWEGSANTPIPGPADRLMRVVAVHVIWEGKNVEALKLLVDLIPEIANEKPEKIEMSYLPDEVGHEDSLFPTESPAVDRWKPTKAA